MYKLLVVSTLLCFLSYVNSDQCDSRYTIKSDLTQEDCPENYYLFANASHDCFNTCVFIDDMSINMCDTLPCPPGYICPEEDFSYCEMDEESCLVYHAMMPGDDDFFQPYYFAIWKPACNLDGTWAAKQCKGESANGRCFCNNPLGERIYGEDWSVDSDTMTCSCSRKRDELMKDPTAPFVSLHCDRQGNYEPLQCNEEQCYCADPATGNILSPIVPESMMHLLPCYFKELVGDQYLRQCESQLLAQKKVKEELRIHGMLQVNLEEIVCDGDGTYGAYKILNNIAYCNWKDNTNIGSWQVPTSGMDGMNCYCAKDSVIYKEIGQVQPLLCETNGNYRFYQQLGKQFYCVDQDGFPTSELLDETEAEIATGNTCSTKK